ncbi:MAG: alpha/beta fold hydrolase [Oscillospiraceae bacterium]|nr:alpha/beta fold hydrolase [Oscillospiraceae bacterium]
MIRKKRDSVIREPITLCPSSDFPLKGMLTLPGDASGPVPAVVMVHGSGPSNMDEKVRKLTPFKDLAEGLVRHGIASLRYDKRTFAHGRKLAKRKDLSVREEAIVDALSAVAMLKSDNRVDPDRIFILGHSQGAMLAPRIDAEGGDAKGLIMMAGSPYRLEEILLRQIRNAGDAGNPLVKWLLGLEYKALSKKLKDLYELSDEEAKKKKLAGNMSLYYFKEMGQKTAADYLLESGKPVLIMQGEEDLQALAAVDFKAFQELLAARPDTAFKLYPGLDHAFVSALTDNPLKASKEFSVERHIGEEVINDIAAFILNAGR